MLGNPTMYTATTALPVIGAIVIGILVFIHRRGGARVTGIIGAALIIVGIIFTPIVQIVGMTPDPSAPGVMSAGLYESEFLTFALQAIPGISLGLGILLVVASAVKGYQRRG